MVQLGFDTTVLALRSLALSPRLSLRLLLTDSLFSLSLSLSLFLLSPMREEEGENHTYKQVIVSVIKVQKFEVVLHPSYRAREEREKITRINR